MRSIGGLKSLTVTKPHVLCSKPLWLLQIWYPQIQRLTIASFSPNRNLQYTMYWNKPMSYCWLHKYHIKLLWCYKTVITVFDWLLVVTCYSPMFDGKPQILTISQFWSHDIPIIKWICFPSRSQLYYCETTWHRLPIPLYYNKTIAMSIAANVTL